MGTQTISKNQSAAAATLERPALNLWQQSLTPRPTFEQGNGESNRVFRKRMAKWPDQRSYVASPNSNHGTGDHTCEAIRKRITIEDAKMA